MNRVRVFIATSLDGFIAGPNDELDWLPSGNSGAEDTFTPFMQHIGALLMGRRTYEVANGFDGPWPYGETPVLVATNRNLEPRQDTARAIGGNIQELVAAAKQVAGNRDVYIDGGSLIRSALKAQLIDDITVTLIPIVLGKGLPLFAGCAERHALDLDSTRSIGGGLVELNYRPSR